jgi:hypothetical protein
MPIDRSSEDVDVRSRLARGTEGARPSPADRGLGLSRPVPDESGMQKLARMRGYAVDFGNQGVRPTPERTPTALEVMSAARGYQLDFKPRAGDARTPLAATAASRMTRNADRGLIPPAPLRRAVEGVTTFGRVDRGGFVGGPLPQREEGIHTSVSSGSYEYKQERLIGTERAGPLAQLRAEMAMRALQKDPNRFFPFRVIGVNGEREILLDKNYYLSNRDDIPLVLPPGESPVYVSERTPTSFTFTAADGHFDQRGSTITFTVRADPSGLVYLDHLGTALPGQHKAEYLVAPVFAERAWDLQAGALRRWWREGP